MVLGRGEVRKQQKQQALLMLGAWWWELASRVVGGTGDSIMTEIGLGWIESLVAAISCGK